MSVTHDLDSILRTLDAADPARTELSARALADLERIVGGASTPPIKDVAAARRRGAPRAVRLLPVAAAAVAVLSLPLLDSAPSAYASWTALPTGVPVSADSPAATWCHQRWEQDATTSNIEPVLVEQRGDYTLVVGEGTAGQESACLARSRRGEETSGGIATQVDRDAGAPEAGTIRVTLYDTSSYTGYVGSSPDPDTIEEATSIVSGRVGKDVASLIVNTPQQGAVHASIVDGRFAAWWPWDKNWTEGPYPDISFDLELTDGTRLGAVPLTEVNDTTR